MIGGMRWLEPVSQLLGVYLLIMDEPEEAVLYLLMLDAAMESQLRVELFLKSHNFL